ncbi:Trifunctional nucleotide phosphoesterase protein YfkN [Apiospora arundinis]|uniref:Trifunctional nucleotide phosphoesterase protein YfkN n=1 Tax=Apiospora arundinis TaxID=335852 RepID=A0ABR2HPP2_9PEZI
MEYFEIIHFNDVYHLLDVDHVSKFASIVTRYASSSPGEDRTFTVFSGDCFSPSLECSASLGDHMIPVLNGLGVDVACPGNHDFDYGEKRLEVLLGKSNTPWTLCNYLKLRTSLGASAVLQSQNMLAGTRAYVVREKRGLRFGFFGLGGTDWPSLCQNLPPCHVEDPARAARTMARHLRRTEKCDVVIAITHMRLAEDILVSNSSESYDDYRVDLLLGGHDHGTVCRFAGDTCSDASTIREGTLNQDIVEKGCAQPATGNIRIIKSGSDFQSFSVLRLAIDRKVQTDVRVIECSVQQVTNLRQTPEYSTIKSHLAIRRHLLDIRSHLGRIIETPLARVGCCMDGREASMRSRETGLGNFLCDMLRLYYNTDVALTNSGSIRSDKIFGVGMNTQGPCQKEVSSSLLRVRDVLEILPFKDTFELKLMSGSDLTNLLEVSVSQDGPDGRFLQTSGILFDVNKSLPAGRRVSNVRLLPSTPVRQDGLYTAAVPLFLARGYDGYDAVKQLPSVLKKGPHKDVTHAELMLRVLGYSMTQEASLPNEALTRTRKGLVATHCQITGLPVIVPPLLGRIQIVESSSD